LVRAKLSDALRHVPNAGWTVACAAAVSTNVRSKDFII